MQELKVIENQGQRVLLTNQIAEIYGTDNQVITNNFNRNKDRYIEGKDYFALSGQDKNEFINLTQFDLGSIKNARTLYLWTEHGALLHAKSLGTDKAWEVYGELVDTYFRVREPVRPMSAIQIMKLHEQAIFELDERVNSIEKKVDKQITLDCGKQRTLQNIISKRAYERAGQAFPKDIRKNVNRFFQAIYKDLKNRFGVASYRDINVKDYSDAIDYVKSWIEPADLRDIP